MKKINRVLCVIFAFIMCLSVFPLSAFAAAVSNPMHDTYVLDDLRTMGYGEELYKYPKDTSNNTAYIIDFTEYGYDYHNNQSYYGLYIYVYNPSGRAIMSSGNAVELSYVDSGFSSTAYKKYSLTMLSVSNDAGMENVFYKFMITSPGTMAYDIARACRQYSVSSMELLYSNESGAKPEAFAVGAKYSFEGYQKYFGIKDEYESTLFRRYEQFEVAEVTLNAASWFTSTSDLGEDYRYELKSVYFNIPNYFINKYGDISDKPSGGGTSGLYSVQGEYYKYVTNGIMVSDYEIYNEFRKDFYSDISSNGSYASGSIGSGYGFYIGDYRSDDGTIYNYYDFSYNMKLGSITGATWLESGYSSSKKALTGLKNSIECTDFDIDYVSTTSFLKQYNSGGRKNFGTSTSLLVSGFNFPSADLGYQSYDISVDDADFNSSFKTYASTHGGLLDRFFKSKLYEDEGGYPIACEPIKEITYYDLNYADTESAKEEFADKLYIMRDDINNLKSFYDENKSDSHVYIMRLDVSPYYCTEVKITDDLENFHSFLGGGSTGYYFEKTVLHDIDVFSFVFRDADANFHTVPVNAQPIDNVGAIIPGNNQITDNNGDPQEPWYNIFRFGDNSEDNGLKWYQYILIIVAILAVLFVIWLFWKVFGGLIIGVANVTSKVSENRRARKQFKIDNYNEKNEIKADKKKRREEKKKKLKKNKNRFFDFFKPEKDSAAEKAKMDEIHKKLNEFGRPFKGQLEAEKKAIAKIVKKEKKGK